MVGICITKIRPDVIFKYVMAGNAPLKIGYGWIRLCGLVWYGTVRESIANSQKRKRAQL